MKQWKKGMAWLLSALCILVTVQIPSIPARAAVSNGQIIGVSVDDAMAYLQELVDAGNAVSINGSFSGECTALVYNYAKYLGCNTCTGAANWYADKNNIQPGFTAYTAAEINYQPQKGDILIWTPGTSSYGYHVAIYKSNTEVYHQNYIVRKPTKQTMEWNSLGTGQSFWGVWRPNFKTNQRPVGAVGNKKVRVAGWAYDPDSGVNTPVGLHIYLGTAENQVETYIGKTVTSINRADGYLGYDVILDTPVSGRKYAYVWALDTAGEDNNGMIGSGIVDFSGG